MKREEIKKAIAEYLERKNDSDKGLKGKKLEVLTRDYLTVRGIQSTKDCRCRSMKSHDITLKEEKGYIVVEVKSNAGAVAYAEEVPFEKEDLTAENICASADFIAYYPCSSYSLTAVNPFETGFMFSRNEFIAMLDHIGKNGVRSCIHTTKHGYQINLQTMSACMEGKFWEFVEEIPTIAEWKEGR